MVISTGVKAFVNVPHDIGAVDREGEGLEHPAGVVLHCDFVGVVDGIAAKSSSLLQVADLESLQEVVEASVERRIRRNFWSSLVLLIVSLVYSTSLGMAGLTGLWYMAC